MVGDAMGRPLAEALAGPLAGTDVSSLFVVSSAGAILSETVREQLQAQMPNVLIRDNFGSTESGFNGDAAPGSGPAGGMRFTVNERTTVFLDEEQRPATPGDGRVGHVAQHGNVPLGYYNDPAKTAETFFEHDGRRWVLLGDMGTLEADGSVSVLGRGSQCINTGGEKVFPEEVEAVLKSHPGVFDAIVAGAPDERFGQPRGRRHPAARGGRRRPHGRRAGGVLPRQIVRLQGAAAAGPGVAYPPFTQRQTRLPLGERAGHRSGPAPPVRPGVTKTRPGAEIELTVRLLPPLDLCRHGDLR